MKKEKLIFCFILLGIVLGLPSIVHLVENNGNITNYVGEYFYFIGSADKILTRLGVVIYAWVVLLMFIIILCSLLVLDL